MRFNELLTEKKKRKSKPKNKYGTAVWGPGPYGLYGWNTGYSGCLLYTSDAADE